MKKKIILLPVTALMGGILGGCTGFATVTWLNYDGTVLEVDKNVLFGQATKYDGETPVKPTDGFHDYIFDGWDADTEKAGHVYKDREIHAQFKEVPHQYEITWVVEGEETKVMTDWDSTPTFTATKEMDDQWVYTFDHWEPEVKKVSGDARYEAVFSKQLRKYVVTWKDYNGSVLKTSNVEYGKTPEYGTAPERAKDDDYAYTFSSWDKTVVPVTGDTEYTAVYKATARKKAYITYLEYGTFANLADTEEGKNLQEVISYDETLIIEPLQKLGHTFAWYVDPECTKLFDGAEGLEDIQGNIYLFGKFELETYHITYQGYEEDTTSFVSEFTVKDELVSLIVPEEKEDYEFTYFTVNGQQISGNSFDPKNFAEDIVVEANWKQKDSPKYDVAFNANGGSFAYNLTFRDDSSTVKAYKVTPDSSVEYPILEDKTNKQFAGWSDGMVGGTISNDYTVYANWVDVEEGATPLKLNEEGEVQLHNHNPSKVQVVSLVEQDLTITCDDNNFAYARVNDNFIGFTQNGDSYVANQTFHVEAGEKLIVEFTGEANIDTSFNCTISGNVTTYDFGKFNAAARDVMYVRETYDTKLKLPEEPMKKDYIFAGWEDDAGNLVNPDDKLTQKEGFSLFAKWEPVN